MGNWVVMRAWRLLLVPIVCLFVSTVMLHPITVQARSSHVEYQYLLAELSSGQAVNLIQARTGGKVLSVVETSRRGVSGYLVKVLMPEGRIRKYFVNRQTGAVAG